MQRITKETLNSLTALATTNKDYRLNEKSAIEPGKQDQAAAERRASKRKRDEELRVFLINQKEARCSYDRHDK